MSPAHSAAALGALLVLASSCVSSRAPSGDGVVFLWSPLSASAVEIEYSAGALPAYQRPMVALCHSAELTMERGFRYLRIYDRERLGPAAARWKLELLDAPPEGAVLLDVAEPNWEGDPPPDGVLDAGSFVASCGERWSRPATDTPR